MQKSNPNKTKGCECADCLACKNGRGNGSEGRRNYVGYILYFDERGIEEVAYVGETGQNVYTRGLRQMANYRGRHGYSPLWKYAQLAHGGSTTLRFSMKVVQRNPLTRQINDLKLKLKFG